MKCRQKDCKDCVHNINIRTHPLFKDFIMKSEDGKIIEFEGCIFHLSILFQRQAWVRSIGIQSAIESHRNQDASFKQAAFKALMDVHKDRLLERVGQ